MATQTIEFGAPVGQTVTARLFAAGSDIVVATATATARTNATGIYTAAFTNLTPGLYRLIGTNAAGTLLCQWWTLTDSATATYQTYEVPPSVIADAVWDEVLTGATHNIQNSAGKRLRTIASQVVHTGTAQGPGTGSNQIQLDTGASATDGVYDPAMVYIESGTGAGQSRLITQYVGSTRTATVDRDWRVVPAADSVFVIQATIGFNSVNEGLAQGGTATTIVLNASANSVDDCYNGQLVFLKSGTGQDQVAIVEDYTGSTRTALIRTRRTNGQWAVVPDSTTGYMMVPNLTWTIDEIQAGLSTLTAAQVNAEVLDVLQTDLFGELAAAPGASSSLKDKIAFLFMLARNKVTQTSSTQTLFADNTTTPVAAATTSDVGGTFTRGEFA